MEFEGRGKNVGGKLIICCGDLTMSFSSNYFSFTLSLNESIVQNTKSCVNIENQSLGVTLLYSLTFKEFLDELNFKRELKVLQVLITIELLQGPVTRAMARRLEEDHRGKIIIFKKMIKDLV
ncbi:hypothetical protein M9H77_16883 [Catharanthus roseus]|uniref:Uncharacterized protein n=1 Tax=Catharanthus roseus TaxID=4058 RepID=A0ACC0B304_CATRO|nr:hypothetical protein M9H77_16883 [Catharanthus roseus]